MPRRRIRQPTVRPPTVRPLGGHQHVESWGDGEWVVRCLTGAAAAKPYRCPGCQQLVAPATAHVVVWPVEGSTLSGGGVAERRHWHAACWRARERRR